MIRAVLHLLNDQPLTVDLVEMPSPGDITVICTNLRTNDGKRPVFIDHSNSTFVFPMAAVRFIEVLHVAVEGEIVPSSQGAAAEPEELEIDEDFLRRVREA